MIPPAATERVTPIMIEGCLTAIAIAAAFAFPRFGWGFFAAVERAFGRLARRKALSVVVVGLAAVLLRLALIPLSPIPHPFVTDDFSFLLAADTFASGRLTNATPVMWQHFESMHITMKPTYMSMYFPAQGLVLAAGKVLAGRAWYGVLGMSALMCAGLVWMLQAWLPPAWALLGGVIAVLRLGLFSYWIDTYSGGGSIAALGGALVLGSLPRFMKTARLRDSLWMGVGMVLLATTRPYEGILLCIPVAVVLGRWMLRGKNRPTAAVLIPRVALPLVLVVAAGAWMGYYDYRAFGSPLTPPYSVDRATYAIAPYFVWQSARPEPAYRHEVMRQFYIRYELNDFKKTHRPSGYVPQTLLKGARALSFFAGIALLAPLIMVRRVFLDRRLRFLVVCVLVLMAGMLIEIFLIPHYLAPFLAAFYAIGLQAMRHLRVWKPDGQPVGMALVRLTVAICVVMTGVRAFAGPMNLEMHTSQTAWATCWYGQRPSGMKRAAVESQLERLPGKQLAIIRYSASHDPAKEWVYNAADIDNSKVVWAREMDAADNRQLIQYYNDRHVWLVQPDMQPVEISPYSLADPQDAGGAVSRRNVSSLAAGMQTGGLTP